MRGSEHKNIGTMMIRNLIADLKGIFGRFPAAAILNCAGLTVSLAVFLLLMARIRHERTYDKSIEDWEDIFRVETNVQDVGWGAGVARPYARLFASFSPHIRSACIREGSIFDMYFHVEGEGREHGYADRFCQASSGILDVFSFQLVEGSREAFDEPGSVLIPESLARRVFGQEEAVGRVLLPELEDARLQVAGVYRDFAPNTSVPNVIYVKMRDSYYQDSWEGWNFLFYVRLDDASHAAQIGQDFNEWFSSAGFGVGQEACESRLVNLHQVHFESDVQDYAPHADRSMLLVLMGLGWVLLIIATVNYANFNMSMAPLRIKSINTCKVFGASTARLRGRLVAESVFLGLVAYVLALLLVYGTRTALAHFIPVSLAWTAQYPVYLLTLGVALLLGLLSGFFPALYSTSFPPALVLKGSFGLSGKGRALRKVLLGIQFWAAFVLFVVALVMLKQNRYMQRQALGYDKDLLIVSNTSRIVRERNEAVAVQLRTHAGVKEVAYAADVLGGKDRYQSWGLQINGKEVYFCCLPVTPPFLKTIGVEVREGRDFLPSDALGECGFGNGKYIFNEAFFREYGFDFPECQGDNVVGMVPDIKFRSMRDKISPMAFYVQPGYTLMYNYVYVRVSNSVALGDAMRHVRETLESFDPGFPFEPRFYDTILQQTYEQERKEGILIGFCCLLAIFVALAGVFSLILFECEYRRKEIAIRKALGATTGGILWRLNRQYLGLVAICFVLSVPVAVYFGSSWLENFAYRTGFPVLVFPLVLLVMGALVAGIVIYQSWHVASEKPLENLKAE